MKTITVEELLSKWWDTKLIDRDELDNLDWDELLSRIGVSVDDYEGKSVIIGDYDDKTYGDTIHVAFVEE